MKELGPSWHFKIVWKDKIALIIKQKLLITLLKMVGVRVVSNFWFSFISWVVTEYLDLVGTLHSNNNPNTDKKKA